MQFKRTRDGVHGWFMVQDATGQPSAIPASDFAVAVVDPKDTRCLNPAVVPGAHPGMFLFSVPESFLVDEGDYTVGLAAPGHRVSSVMRKFHVVR